MKRIPLVFMALSFGLLQSCTNNTTNDSKQMADSANEANAATNDSGTNAASMAVDENDSKFVVEAADGGMAEVELGKLAQSKGSNASVKSFGQMMVDDHSKANDELKQLAQSKNITLPATVGQAHQKVMDELNTKSGKDFDKAYMDAMISDHKKDISLFEDASNNLKDPDLKAFAAKTLPTLKMHLEHCQKVKDQMK